MMFCLQLQSAYRRHHSTETALLKVKNDILMNMENQKVTLLVLLDLSAAFDTVDHRILLDRLQFDFGISGSALNWIESYLSNRTQRIYIDGVLSSNFNLKFGVPQDSCLGPLLFSLYASKLFRSSSHISLIPIVMQMTHNCTSRLDQEMIWRRPLL